MRGNENGAVLVLVLVVLMLLALLGAAVSRHATQRMLTAADYRMRMLNPAGGTMASSRANIDDGANSAPY